MCGGREISVPSAPCCYHSKNSLNKNTETDDSLKKQQQTSVMA